MINRITALVLYKRCGFAKEYKQKSGQNVTILNYMLHYQLVSLFAMSTML